MMPCAMVSFFWGWMLRLKISLSLTCIPTSMVFRGSSAGKESTYNAGDPCLIPGSGRSPAEGIGYPLLCSWASLVAQMVKNLPAMQETWVQSLGWEDCLEEGMATHSSILTWRIPMDRKTWQATVHGAPKSQTWLRLNTIQYSTNKHIQELLSIFSIRVLEIKHFFFPKLSCCCC